MKTFTSNRLTNTIKLCIKLILSLCVFTGLFLFFQRLLMPKYASGVTEGAMIGEFYGEEKDFDVIFIGDCEVYENFSPVTLWENYGINSYIRGSAEQYIFQSYYVLKDTLRYETPKVVVFNVQSMQFDVSQNEAYNRMTIDGMRWSDAKIGCIKASLTEKEHFLEYLFPVLRYHSRWKELTSEDLEYLFQNPSVTHNGYYLRTDIKGVQSIPKKKPLGDYSFGENAWKYLDKIRECCEEYGITLILIKAPSLYPYWYEEWDAQIKEYAAGYGLTYINFLEHTEEIGLDYNTDTYDGGLHMNLYGAEKCADYLGGILSEEFQVPDRRAETVLNNIWNEKIDAYNREISLKKQENVLIKRKDFDEN